MRFNPGEAFLLAMALVAWAVCLSLALLTLVGTAALIWKLIT